MSKLAEALIVHRWWKSRAHEQEIRISLSPFKEHDLIDIRSWFQNDEGRMCPGKGFSVAVRHLPELATAIGRALDKATELGLLDTGAPPLQHKQQREEEWMP
jgi:hypothetical protein